MIIKAPSDIIEKSDIIEWMVANKAMLMDQKKSEVKFADPFAHVQFVNDRGEIISKAESAISATATKIQVDAVVNTTKIFDSHDDVHFDGIWNKSVKESRGDYLVKMHQFNWEGIISDEVKVRIKNMRWGELNFTFKGDTEALIYRAIIDKEESPLMFEKYIKGKVKEHSVGMRYIKMELGVMDDRWEKEHAVWKKYADLIVNKKDAEARGYFWGVFEAKNIEGSAVPRGSNYATPTLSVTEVKTEPSEDTPKSEPVLTTQKAIDILKSKNIFE